MLVALRNSEAQWRSLVENAPDIIFTVNRQGEILFINHAPAGLSAQEAVGASVFDYVPPEHHETVRQALDSVFETGQPASYEIAARGPHGSPAWYATRLGPIKHNDHVHAAILITRDISAHKQAEAALQQTLDTLQAIVEASPPAIIHLDPEGIVTSWNPAAERLFGWSASEAVGRLLPYVPPEKMEEFQELRARVLQGEGFHEVEAQRRRKDDQEITISISTAPTRDPQGNITGILAVIDDITARKAAELALQASEEKYRLIVETAQEGIWVIDAENRTTFANSRMAEMLGYTVDEMLGQPLFAFMDDEARARAEANLERRKQGIHEQHEIVFRRKDGAPLWALVSTNPLFDRQGNYRGAQAMVTDISALKQAQQAERDQRVLAEALAHTARALISAPDIDAVMGTILENVALVVPHDAANIMLIEGDQARPVYWRGYRPEQVSLLREFRLALAQTPNLQHMLATGQPFLASDTDQYPGWVQHPVAAWVKSYVAAPIRSHGNVIGFLNVDSGTPGLFTEVHARRLLAFADQASIAIERAQLYEQIQRHADELEQRVQERTAQLNHAKERIEAILNSSNDVVILCHIDGTIDQVNPAFVETFGATSDEAYRQPLATLVIPDHAPLLGQAFETVVRTQRPERLEVTARCEARLAFDADIVLSPVVGPGKALFGVVCSLRDITQRKQMEAHLRQMLEREMEMNELKSRFVSMAAHDLRNPLAVIQSAVGMLHDYYDRLSEEQKQSKFDSIQASIKVMVEMLDDILTLGKAESGKFRFEPAPLDVVAFCQDMVAEIRQAAGTARPIVFSSRGDCGTAYMDAKLLRHIVGNLLSNALKYSPEDSTVSFAIDCGSDQITFRVQDNGIGIPEADQRRLFEAFHRASNAGHIPGTGLGLAIVKQTVELHGGAVAFESQEGVGTTFTVTLPRHQ